MTTMNHARRGGMRPRIMLPRALLVLVALVLVVSTVAQAKDSINYSFTFVHPDGSTTVVSGTASSNTAWLADAGGTDPDNPIGMYVHVSCSDPFTDGWGVKDGPSRTRDSAWRIQSYTIMKGSKVCGSVPTTPPPNPSIDIEKATNGYDADTPKGPEIPVGDTVTWTYVVTNDGNVDLDDVVVTDDIIGAVGTIGHLAVGASSTLTKTGVAEAGQYANVATAVGTAHIGVSTQQVSATTKGKFYAFLFVDPATGDTTFLQGTINKNDQYIADAGGTSQDNPIGMTMHLSCSDKFPGGYGAKAGPSRTRDSAWKIQSFWIYETDGKGKVKSKCGAPFTTDQQVEDSDPSHYFGTTPNLPPKVDIEKYTNGEDADEPPGPTVTFGSTITWTFVVTNTGPVDLKNLVVTDNKEGHIGPSPYSIAYLAVGDSVTLTKYGTAVHGQYVNKGCVVGESVVDGTKATDCDKSHYDPPFDDEIDDEIDDETVDAIALGFSTNGVDADTPTGPKIVEGDRVTWTYRIENLGGSTVYGVYLFDERIGHVDCPARRLAAGASMTCTATGTAVLGQYSATAWVDAWTDVRLSAHDSSNYLGVAAGAATQMIRLETATNGSDADQPTGPRVAVGSTVTWTYRITNLTDERLYGVYLYDEEIGQVTCPARSLAAGATMTCTATGVARAGQYGNVAWVDAWAGSTQVSDTDPSHYFGEAG